MTTAYKRYDAIIVGAGIAGLLAAKHLHQHGRKVLVIDKSSGVGGRMASRRVDKAVFDHGAQFITARENVFLNWLEELTGLAVVERWFGGKSEDRWNHPRWRGKPAMTSIAKYLCKDLEVKLNTRVESVTSKDGNWRVFTDTSESIQTDSLLLTQPVPQILDLLDISEMILTSTTTKILQGISYERCIAVLARLAEPSPIPDPGFIRNPCENMAWVADNQRKGVSPSPALTIHATPDFSLNNWKVDRLEVGEIILAILKEQMKINVVDYQVHGWKFAKPKQIYEQRTMAIVSEPLLLLAGDAFGGPRVEGAALSGWDAAWKLEKYLQRR